MPGWLALAIAAASMDDKRQLVTGWRATTDAVEQLVAERQFGDALSQVGHEDRHALLMDWYLAGLMSEEDLASCILDAWEHGARKHLDELGSGAWLEMFAFCGFVASPPRARPARPLTVYRAQPESAPELGMSWTTDLAIAKWFRDRWISRDVPAVVLVAVAPPAAVLGMTDDREEHEVIVDPSLLADVVTDD